MVHMFSSVGAVQYAHLVWKINRNKESDNLEEEVTVQHYTVVSSVCNKKKCCHFKKM